LLASGRLCFLLPGLFAGLAEAEALAVHREDVAAVSEAVQQRLGQIVRTGRRIVYRLL